MTIIAAIVKDGKTYMGADRGVSSGDTCAPMASPKLFESCGLIFGGCGEVTLGLAIQHHLSVKEWDPERKSFEVYVVRKLLPAMSSAVKSHGFHKKECDKIQWGGSFLVAAPGGHLVQVGNGWSVAMQRDWMVDGSGSDVASGYLHATQSADMKPRDRLKSAMTAACDLNAWCKPPFDFLEI